MSAKYIFVTGGVVSSLGKGLAAASNGCLLEARGLRVNLMKFDPYLNVDPGTMSPFQHGEVFVTDDGAETDLDLGPLRALHPRAPHARQQPHHRAHLRTDHHQGAPRRLPRQDRPGHPARHQRDQERHAQGRARLRHRHRRDRWHGRRHRIAAVPRSHSPDAPGSRPREHLLRPRHPHPLDRRRAGAQD